MRVFFKPENGAQAKNQPQSKKGEFGAVLDTTVSAANRSGGLESVFSAAASRFGLRPELLKAVAQAESNFNPKAVSKAGAQGIMQLMPATARGLGVRDPFNPVENIFAGAAYLRSLLDRFDGNETLALAAYNAGPGAVARYGGVPPYRETQAYVARVLGLSDHRTGVAVAPAGGSTDSVPDNSREYSLSALNDPNNTAVSEDLSTVALVMRYALMEYVLHASESQEEEQT
ncbi:MAG: lytic transglycosylase domain-containing protein [Bacillota bacterium]